MLRWWEHTPKKYWMAVDWETWEKEGRPKVPRHLELQDPLAREIGTSVVIPPAGPKLATGFSMFTKPRAGNARSQAIDELLDDIGIRPRK